MWPQVTPTGYAGGGGWEARIFVIESKNFVVLPRARSFLTRATGGAIQHAKAAALRSVLEEVGYANALLARQPSDGRLMLIDGHLRGQKPRPTNWCRC